MDKMGGISKEERLNLNTHAVLEKIEGKILIIRDRFIMREEMN